MKFFLFLSLFLEIPLLVHSQEVLLEKNLSKSVYFKKSGINHTHFGYPVVMYSPYFFNKSGEVPIIPAKSHRFSVGYRWNHRVYGIYSAGFSATYVYDVFALKQNSGKIFPNTILHQKEKVQKHNAALEVYNRFILKKQYNQLGIYFDAGLYGSWAFATRHKMQDRNDDPAYSGSIREVTLKNPDYIEPFTAGMLFRLGYNRYSLVADYRISNWLKTSYHFSQPPKVCLGLEVSLY